MKKINSTILYKITFLFLLFTSVEIFAFRHSPADVADPKENVSTEISPQYTIQPPVITDVSSLNAAPGTIITLTGSNFNPVPDSNIVFLEQWQHLQARLTQQALL